MLPRRVCAQAGIFKSLDEVLAYLKDNNIEHDPNNTFAYLKGVARRHAYATQGYDNTPVKKVKLNNPSFKLSVKDIKEIAEKLASSRTTKKMFKSVRFTLEGIDDNVVR